jgi:formate/nitrite transporter FocA (FNT family)
MADYFFCTGDDQQDYYHYTYYHYIGIGGLHHAIIGSIEVFTALLTSGSVTLDDYFHVQLWATIGNIFGGVVFVAFVKFSHVNPEHKYLGRKKDSK